MNMKTVICLLVTIFTSAILYSQDVIVTKEGEEIEVKIIAESSTFVEYVELNAQDGARISLPTDKILTIIYADGRVNMYPGEKKQENELHNYRDYILRKGNKYSYKGVNMTSSGYAQFLKENDPELHKTFCKAHNISMTGWVVFGLGALCCTIPIWNREGAITDIVVGTLTMAAGGVTLVVGYNRMHNTVDAYNAKLNNTSSVSWSVIASQNGIGLALNF
jgi:hypothetical protein